MGKAGVIAVSYRRKVKYPLFVGVEAMVMLLLSLVLWPKYLSGMLFSP